MSLRAKRGVLFIVLLLLPFIIGLLFTYEIIGINFPTDMEHSPAVSYLDGPRIPPPEGAVSTNGKSISIGSFPENPIQSDEISIERGDLLYAIHCALCHGENGKGDGPLTEFYTERPPGDLTAPNVAAQFDAVLFRTISFGFGQMPPLVENLTPRERWDVINFLRNLQQ